MALTSANIESNVSGNVPFGTVSGGIGSLGALPASSRDSINIAAGTGVGQGDILYVAGVTATTGGLSLDLNGGGLLQIDGTAANFVKIIYWKIVHRGTAGVLTYGGGSNPVAGISGTLGPGTSSVPTIADGTDTNGGWTVTPSTGDILKLVASAGTIPCDVILIGRSV
jgi:hypothetical protein